MANFANLAVMITTLVSYYNDTTTKAGHVGDITRTNPTSIVLGGLFAPVLDFITNLELLIPPCLLFVNSASVLRVLVLEVLQLL